MKKLISKVMLAVMVAGLLAPGTPVQAQKTPADEVAVVEQRETKATAAELRTALAAAKKDTAAKKTAMYAAHRKASAANEKEKLGSYGFFKEYGYTAACKVLESKNSAVTAYTKIGQSSDSTSLKNLKATIPFLKEANSLRAQERVDPQATSVKLQSLQVSMYLMAVSEVQTNWSSYNMGHSRMYNVAENIAWGYSDPFVGWYNQERTVWMNGSRDFMSVGHYLNLCNSEYTITGFAVNQYSGYGVTHGQTFIWPGSAGETMTVAQFEAKLNKYCKSISDARTAYKNAKAAYEQALAYENQLQAQLDAIPVTYRITYVLNGGTNNKVNPTTYDINTATVTLQNPTRAGYTFVGWYRDAAYSQRITQIVQGTTGNLKLYAKWKKTTGGTVSGLKLTGLSYRRIRVNYKAATNAVGYQIRYSTSEKMTGAKAVYTNNVKHVITGLKAGTVYYVQVRAYNRDSVGTAVYGSWSQKKSVKVFR